MRKLTAKTKLLNALRKGFQLRPAEVLLARLVRGREHTSLLGKLPPNHYQYSRGSRRRVARHGTMFDLDISDLVDWWVYFGIHEPVLGLVEQFVRPGDTCIDCGANIGSVSFFMAHRVGRGGRVLSFEPHPINANRFRDNLALNDFPQVELCQSALGETEGVAVMVEVEPTNLGMNRIDPESTSGGVEVEMMSLDRVVSEKGLDDVRLLKIDVEGFEERVLAGASTTLERLRPVLVIEVNTAHLEAQGGHPRNILDMLSSLGYECRAVGSGEPVSKATEWSGVHIDLLAVPKQ